MSSIRNACLAALAALFCLAAPGVAQELTALAHVRPSDTTAKATPGGGVEFRLALDRAVPWRVFTLDAPPRLVLDFSELDWSGLAPEALRAPGLGEISTGRFRPGWSRMVVALDAPLAIASAAMTTTDGGAVVTLRLDPTDPESFAARAGAPPSALFALPEPVRDLPPAMPRQRGDRPLRVMLDPGHGGIDPGAERAGLREADLMLTFARELADVLRRSGMEVHLTREADAFVPLEARQSLARAAGADVFISLHADALAEGRARGATVYTLSESASDAASALLAERHDRADLLAGLDLSNHDDVVADVLMDLARLETQPRSERLADAIVAALGRSIGNLHKRPRGHAHFSVLKAPDIPSVLIELGFLSDPRDRERLADPSWRRRAAEAIGEALAEWALIDAAEASLVRK
jgi:N-acetylmuramoyl-L-alanine amidase